MIGKEIFIQIGRWIDRHIYRQMDTQRAILLYIDRQIGRYSYERKELFIQIGRWIDRQVDIYIDGYIGRYVDGCERRILNVKTVIYYTIKLKVFSQPCNKK